MTYSQQTWANDPGGGTPLDATRLNHMEAGIAAAAAAGKAVTFVVAASDSPESVRNAADYVCDGTDDQVTINTAINSLSTLDPTAHTDNFNQANGSWSSPNGWVTPFLTTETNKLKFPASGFFYTYNTTYEAPHHGRIQFDWTVGNNGGYIGWGTNTSIANGYFVEFSAFLGQVLLRRSYNSTNTYVGGTFSHTFTTNNTYTFELIWNEGTCVSLKIDGVTAFSNVDLSSPTEPVEGRTPFIAFSSSFLGPNYIDNLIIQGELDSTGTVQLCDGTYSLSGPVNVSFDGMSILGAPGTVLEVDPATVASTPIVRVSGNHCTVEGIEFKSLQSQTNPVVGIHFGRIVNITARKNTFTSFYGKCINVDSGGYLLVTDNIFYKFIGNSAIFLDGAYEVLISNNRFLEQAHGDTTFYGIEGQYNGATQITGNYFDYGCNGIKLWDDSYGDDGPSTVTGNNFYYMQGISLKMTYQFGCGVSDNAFDEGSGVAMQMDHCDQINVSSNVFTFNDVEALIMEGCCDCAVVGNTFGDNNSGTGSAQFRIRSSSEATPVTSKRNMVQANQIRYETPLGHDAYYGNDPEYGLVIASGSLNNWVTNNDFRSGGTISGFSDSGTGTITTSGNQT